ncbi:MAG: hypothetical protein J7M14_06410 [Planctomycetes bacterium]|nr:hypothetical protein [Planctomycetota bacterium]
MGGLSTVGGFDSDASPAGDEVLCAGPIDGVSPQANAATHITTAEYVNTKRIRRLHHHQANNKNILSTIANKTFE